MDQSPRILVVTIIVDGEDHALRMAETLVLERLCASANVQSAHTSYRWEDGELIVYREHAIRAVTVPQRFEALCERVSALPGIVLPGVTAAATEAAHPLFEPWIRQVFQACRADG
jgi:uncharacterized protein involved in tolerance to divalent cations